MASEFMDRHGWGSILLGFASALRSQAWELENSVPRTAKTIASLMEQHNKRKEIAPAIEALNSAADRLQAAGACPPSCAHPSHAKTYLELPDQRDEEASIETKLDQARSGAPAYSAPINAQIEQFIANCRKHPAIGDAHLAASVERVHKYQKLTRRAYSYFRAMPDSSAARDYLETLAAQTHDAEQELEAELERANEELTEGDSDVSIYTLDGVCITGLYHPLHSADTIASLSSASFKRHKKTFGLLKAAIEALARAIEQRDFVPGNAEDLKAALVTTKNHARRFGGRYESHETPAGKKGRPSLHAERYALIAALVKAAPPGSPAEIAEVLTTRYLMRITAQQISTDLHNIERDDRRRPISKRLLPARPKQKPGRRPRQ